MASRVTRPGKAASISGVICGKALTTLSERLRIYSTVSRVFSQNGSDQLAANFQSRWVSAGSVGLPPVVTSASTVWPVVKSNTGTLKLVTCGSPSALSEGASSRMM